MPAVDHDAVLREWLERTLRSYPEQSARFLLGEKDPFRNPVGQTYREALLVLLEYCSGPASEPRPSGSGSLDTALESILKLRAVEQRPPSQALAFIFDLKALLPERSGPIDELALHAFDVYMRCREQLWEIRMRSRP